MVGKKPRKDAGLLFFVVILSAYPLENFFFEKNVVVSIFVILLRCTIKLIQYFCSTQNTFNIKEDKTMFNKTLINKRIFTRPLHNGIREKRYRF